MTSAARPARLDSVDILRGAVMVVMALDHVRDFFSSAHFDPMELERTWPALFFTRWITHFCAPTFVFLAGTGSYLSLAGGKPKGQIARFLVTRGVWLVVLENTIVRASWNFDVAEPFLFWQVIWAIGISMIVLAGLIYLPLPAIFAFGAAMIVGHDLLDRFDARLADSMGGLWRVLHLPGPLVLGPLRVFDGYPLVPWIGVMAVGYAFGALLRGDGDVRRRRLLLVGSFTVLAFVLLRASNVYGDRFQWSPQRTPVWTVMSFLDCMKYPPSLCYLLMTLGPAVLALAALDRVRGEGLAKPLVVFGRVPMFFYLLHIPLIHGLAVLAGVFRYGHVEHALVAGPFSPTLESWGYPLPAVYAWWVFVVLLLYPACAWFAGVKKRRTDAWLRFL